MGSKSKLKSCQHFIVQYLSLDSSLLGIVVIRETKKDLRKAQNKVIQELEPLIVTFHLPSMKILFTNVVTEEVVLPIILRNQNNQCDMMIKVLCHMLFREWKS